MCKNAQFIWTFPVLWISFFSLWKIVIVPCYEHEGNTNEFFPAQNIHLRISIPLFFLLE